MEIAAIVIKENLTPSSLEKLLGVNLLAEQSESWAEYKNGNIKPKHLIIHTTSSGSTYIQVSLDDFNPLLDKNQVLKSTESVTMVMSTATKEYAFIYQEKDEVSMDYYNNSNGWKHAGSKDYGLSNEKEIHTEYDFIMNEYLGEIHDSTTVQVYSFMPKETYESVSTIEGYFWKKTNLLLTDNQIIENFAFYYLENQTDDTSKGYIGFMALAVIRQLLTAETDANMLVEKHTSYAMVKAEVEGLTLDECTKQGEHYKSRLNSISRPDAYRYFIINQKLIKELIYTLKGITGVDKEPSILRTIGSVVVGILIVIKILSLISRLQ